MVQAKNGIPCGQENRSVHTALQATSKILSVLCELGLSPSLYGIQVFVRGPGSVDQQVRLVSIKGRARQPSIT